MNEGNSMLTERKIGEKFPLHCQTSLTPSISRPLSYALQAVCAEEYITLSVLLHDQNWLSHVDLLEIELVILQSYGLL